MRKRLTLLSFLVSCIILCEGNKFFGELQMGFRVLSKKTLEHSDSKVRLSLNPSCTFPECSVNATAITVANITISNNKANTTNQNQYIWSVIGNPAIQAAITKPGDYATVDWKAIFGFGDLDSSIRYQHQPDYSAAIMLKNLIEYNDEDDLGYFNPEIHDYIVYPIKNFAWKRILLENSTDRWAYAFIGENYTVEANSSLFVHNVTSGKLNLTFSAYAGEGFGFWLPHLSHSSSSNQFDIQVDQLQTNSEFNRTSRFALEFYMVSDAEEKSTLPFKQCTRTLDDEHTPGIFKTQELIIPGYNKTLQSYLQWRPVVYTTVERDLSSSTNVNVSDPTDVLNPQEVLKHDILYAFYGIDLEDMLVKSINVSLGAKGDGWYHKTKYQAWTFSFGTGEPLHNGMSPLIVLVMTSVFGVLLLVLATSALVCLIKKCCRRREQGYVHLNAET